MMSAESSTAPLLDRSGEACGLQTTRRGLGSCSTSKWLAAGVLTGRVLQTAGAWHQNPTLGGGYTRKGSGLSAVNLLS